MTTHGPRPATADNRSRKDLRVSIFHVPACPHVDTVRSHVEAALEDVGATAIIEFVEGPYLSPTLLIDGIAMAGYGLTVAPSCRIDLPDQEQVRSAILAADARNNFRAEQQRPA